MFRLFEKLDLDLNLPKLPFWMFAIGLILVLAAPLPMVLIARSRYSVSPNTRVHLAQDMDKQPRYGAQDPSPIFADGRAMRQPVAGTVAWGARTDRPAPDALREDDHLYRGYQLVQDEGGGALRPDYFTTLPAQIIVNDGLLNQGQQQFMTYCYPCHGADGHGNGPITMRGTELQRAGSGTMWAQAADLHTLDNDGNLLFGPEQYPDGMLFHVIGYGKGNMAGYRDQISVSDRWAIVTYVRAMQLSQNARADELPAQLREQLRR